MIRVLCILIGYVFGCVQTAFLIGKIKANIDIRKHGSGNAGTSNVVRVLGFGAGVIVFVVDVLKAVVAIILCTQIFDSSSVNILVIAAYAGFGAVLGHNFPIFLKFKGGKGIATSLGIVACLDWQAALIIIVIGLVTIALTKYISLGSITMLSLFPITMFVFGYEGEIIIISLILAAMALFLHRENIKRLIAGKERKFSFFKE